MRDRRVAMRYATALFNLAIELGKLEEIDVQALALKDVFEDKELKRFFSQPLISRAKKADFIEKTFKSKVHPSVLNLLAILLHKGRISIASDVFDYFDLLSDRYRGIEEVRVITAVPVEDQFVSRLIERLRKFSNYPDLRVTTTVDPKILGGAKVYLGRHTVIDGSLSTRLATMREKLVVYKDY
jgi:F-type H+-transporting ATPase subunit delta